MTAEPLSVPLAATATPEAFNRSARRARVRLLHRMEQESLWLAHHKMDVAMIGTMAPPALLPVSMPASCAWSWNEAALA